MNYYWAYIHQNGDLIVKADPHHPHSSMSYWRYERDEWQVGRNPFVRTISDFVVFAENPDAARLVFEYYYKQANMWSNTKETANIDRFASVDIE